MWDILKQFVDLFLHLDRHLDGLIQNYGWWSYVILFLIVFAETGLVFTPFLPGDSLLFAAGAIAGTRGSLRIEILFILLTVAAIAGDTVNYWIGKYLGKLILDKGRGRFIKQSHLDRTHAFFEKYGGKTIVIARFVPIVRTFAPFVAGLGTMSYSRFLLYNIVGGVAWVAICVFSGYFFGGLPWVKNNFTLVILAIIIISIMPIIIEFVLHKRRQPSAPPPQKVTRDP